MSLHVTMGASSRPQRPVCSAAHSGTGTEPDSARRTTTTQSRAKARLHQARLLVRSQTVDIALCSCWLCGEWSDAWPLPLPIVVVLLLPCC